VVCWLIGCWEEKKVGCWVVGGVWCVSRVVLLLCCLCVVYGIVPWGYCIYLTLALAVVLDCFLVIPRNRTAAAYRSEQDDGMLACLDTSPLPLSLPLPVIEDSVRPSLCLCHRQDWDLRRGASSPSSLKQR